MIDPEVAPPAPQPRHRRLVVAGVTVLALVAGGFAVTPGGDGPEPKPLALLTTNRQGDASGAETMSAAAPAPAAGMASADASMRSSAPYYGGWGLKFEVAGDLPELGDRAAAWKATGPGLDRAAVARIGGALGLTGSPVERDGGWEVDGGDWTLNAFPGDVWSVNLFRGRFDGRPDDARGAGATAGPGLSRPEAERRVRDLLDRMGAPAGSWKVEVTETEIGIGWACASPAFPDGELKRLEAEKLRNIEQQNPGLAPASASAGSPSATPATPAPAAKPAPDAAVASCPPPPAPAKGFNVAVHPELDGHRGDWPVWNVTMRSDGRIEGLYGSWVTFERAGDYKLRGVSAALKELRNPPVPDPGIAGGVVTDPATPAIAVDGGPAIDVPASPPGGSTFDVPANTGAGPTGSAGAGSTGSAGAAVGVAPAPSRLPLEGGAATPAIEPAPPVCPPTAMPLPADKSRELHQTPHSRPLSSFAPGCGSPEPMVVTITGVELGLIQVPVWQDGKSRLHLVPAYRFTGRFKDGTAWETSVVALHHDAIAPPAGR